MTSASQPQLVLAYLKLYPSLTSAIAFRRWNHTRLAHTIYILRKRGHPIKTVAVKRGQSSFARYQLR